MENTRIIHVMVGPPGAGKSTYRVKDPVLSKGVLICPDELLYEDGKYVWDPIRLGAAWKKCYQRFGLALRRSEGHVVWDATFSTEISRSAILHTAMGFGYEVEAIHLNTPLETCIARNAKRSEDRRVPETAIRAYFEQFKAPSVEEGFARVIVA